jgi:hypothetical protein
MPPIAQRRTDDLDVAIAIARPAVVVGVLVATIVLRNPMVVMGVMGTSMGGGSSWRDRGNAECQQQERSAQQTTDSIDEHG